MTTVNIILAVSLCAIAYLLGRSRIINHRLASRNRKLKFKINTLMDAGNHQWPSYYVGTVMGDDGVLYPAAMREVTMDGEGYYSVVKVFNTTDMEYNNNCAHDIVDTLNEGLCYD